MAEEKQENKTSTSKAAKTTSKKSNPKAKKITLNAFIGLVGLNPRLRTWAKKMYKDVEPMTAINWYLRLKEDGAMDKLPDVLK